MTLLQLMGRVFDQVHVDYRDDAGPDASFERIQIVFRGRRGSQSFGWTLVWPHHWNQRLRQHSLLIMARQIAAIGGIHLHV